MMASWVLEYFKLAKLIKQQNLPIIVKTSAETIIWLFNYSVRMTPLILIR